MIDGEQLLNHTDLYHVFLHVTDVEAAMAALSDQFGLTWLPVQSGRYWTRIAGEEPIEHDATTVYSRQGPLYLELGHVPNRIIPEGTDLLTPHHFGYWCDDVPAARESLVRQGWTLEFEVGRDPQDLSVPYLIGPSGYRVELIPREFKAKFDAYVRSG